MYKVILFYIYTPIPNPNQLKDSIGTLCNNNALLGRVLIANEGVNATLGGLAKDVEAFCEELKKVSCFNDIKIKSSNCEFNPFPRLSIKIRNEIVGTRFPKELADPRVKTAPYIKAEELHEMYRQNDDFVIVDMRNDYEYKVGHFKNSYNPKLNNSRDLPEKLEGLEKFKHKKTITVCTGGIRCEKMSAFLINNGFDNVYQLEEGMHDYMQKFPGEDFLGALYTFDERVTMHFGGNREIIGKCEGCGSKTEHYINCNNQNCHKHFLMCLDCVNNGELFCGVECKKNITSN